MRMMMRVQMGTEETNEVIKRGEMAKVMKDLMGQLHPEAAYFTAQDGNRTGYVFFDMKQPDQIPSVAEPLFLKLGAKIDFCPAMTPEEVDSGLRKAAKMM